MLEIRNMIGTLSGETLRDYLQGSVLTLLLWSLMVDKLLTRLNGCSYYAVEYADDMAVLINGSSPTSLKFPRTVSGVNRQCWDIATVV
jgi:hypothetical protein